ncbi:MAG TPA: VanW family protein [Kamptonema sp.]|nr:VanW family protein [Kamptonema sp.]
MKKLLPSSLRLSLRVYQRQFQDIVTGVRAKLVDYSQQRVQNGSKFTPQITIVQPIYSTALSENKIHNLKLAIQRLENLTIEPGEIISFWHLVGNPDRAHGYLIGRSLIQNELKANYGGGLCQLSGLLYFLALKAGLLIVERASHSLDIYTEETRFAPLGSDATVVYGYKDLRLQNCLTMPICFRFKVQSNEIVGMLCATAPVFEYNIEFREQKIEASIRVETLQYAKDSLSFKIINTGIYQKIKNA